jgi:hypothetical protein
MTQNKIRFAATKHRLKIESKVLASNNQKAVAGYIKYRLKTSQEVPTLIDTSSGQHAFSDSEKADLLADCFTENFSVPSTVKSPPPIYPCNRKKQCIVDFSPVNLFKYLKALPNKLSYSPEGINQHVMKNCAAPISLPLSLIFTESYNSGILPVEWKLSTIVPVFKNGSKSNPSNYRPINLTSPIARLMEKMISESIRDSYKFFFDNNQFGFLRGRSCVQSILYSQSLWEKALKGKLPVDVIYFDFKKAFDKINHTLLLAKLEQIGLDEKLQKWFSSFLSNRSCVVKVGNSLSNREIPMHSGVPQGTVTGPLLFLIFINDIYQCIPPTVSFTLFADDLKIFGSDSVSLQLAIDNVNNWSQKWDLPLANTKINALYLGANNSRV